MPMTEKAAAFEAVRRLLADADTSARAAMIELRDREEFETAEGLALMGIVVSCTVLIETAQLALSEAETEGD